jgi:hypothetical protein
VISFGIAESPTRRFDARRARALPPGCVSIYLLSPSLRSRAGGGLAERAIFGRAAGDAVRQIGKQAATPEIWRESDARYAQQKSASAAYYSLDGLNP